MTYQTIAALTKKMIVHLLTQVARQIISETRALL